MLAELKFACDMGNLDEHACYTIGVCTYAHASVWIAARMRVFILGVYYNTCAGHSLVLLDANNFRFSDAQESSFLRGVLVA